MIIVFGASGFVGSYLFRRFRKISRDTVGTFSSHPIPGAVRFDLLQSRFMDLTFDRDTVRHAVIAAADTDIDRVKRDPSASHALNVEATIRLIDDLSAVGIVPIFLSTDHVFDGKKGGYREEDERNPTTLYGAQKVTVEDHLIRNIPRHIIVRISRIYSFDADPKNWPVSWMLRSFREGRAISCATDQRFCVTTAADIAAGIETIIRRDADGIWHMAAPRAYSRWEIALRLCDKIGADPSLIKPVGINELNFLEERPVNLALDSTRFVASTGFVFTDIMNCLDTLIDVRETTDE